MSSEYAKSHFFWKVQYTIRNDVFRERADTVLSIEREIAKRHGIDDPWDVAESRPRSFGAYVDECRETEGCWDQAVAILDEYQVAHDLVHAKCSPLEMLDKGEELKWDCLPPFYHNAFVYDDQFGVRKVDGRNVLTVTLDLDSPEKAILRDVSGMVEIAREAHMRGVPFMDVFKARWAETNGRSTPDMIAVGEGGYQSTSNSARAMGLWLWDYIQRIPGKKINAIRALEDKCVALGVMPHGDEELYGYLRRTGKCIESCKVLSFSRKKQG